MMRNTMWLNSLIRRATPLACSPTRFRALPNSTEVEMDVGAAAQAQAVGDHQAEDQGDGGEDFEVDHRLQADAADLLQVTGGQSRLAGISSGNSA
ncbi:hypothetical protein RLJV_23755 [Pseudomonas aeruginosa]|nr:hypothetical protein RLJV_23755 [Pseudomonas aeruginosa]